MKNYKKLKVWQTAIEIVKEVYILNGLLPENEKYGLRNQITRAAVSIPSNIAEGSSRQSDKDYKRFLEMALGSLFELETQLIILIEIGMINSSQLANLLTLITSEQKMLHTFINKLTANSQ